MTAVVTKNTAGRFPAWREPCHDGYQAATKQTANKWAAKHNAGDRHRPTA